MELSTNTKIKMTPKDFFLYIGVMAMLYVSIVSLVALLFHYIDFLLPDRLDYYVDPYASGVRWQMASLIVIFPVYLFLTRLVNRDVRVNPDKKQLGIRRWLIYLTLFAAGVTLLIDLVVLINSFLGGELTLRFALKVFTVLLVVGAAFLYYFFDLKGRWEEKEKIARAVAWVAGSIVLASVVFGFFIMGSPYTQRLIRFDAQKVSDLQNIQWQIVNFWQQKEVLPETLSELEDPIAGFIAPKDPETGNAYGYRTVAPLTFELCAEFNQEGGARGGRTVFPKLPAAEEGIWEHGAGEVCFSRMIDPLRYPPQPKRPL